MTLNSPNVFVKDPQAILDYAVDWTEWLNSDTIATVAWVVPAGITNPSVSNTSTVATIWLSSGTVGQSYDITCRITTIGGRTDERTITLTVRNK